MRDWFQIIAQAFGMDYSPDPDLRLNRSLLWLLAIGTIPVGIAGLAFEHAIENIVRTNQVIIGVMLVGVGLLMWYADRVSRLSRSTGNVNLADALAIGGAQALAVVPGTSRSGITITAGLLRNLDRRSPRASLFSYPRPRSPLQH